MLLLDEKKKSNFLLHIKYNSLSNDNCEIIMKSGRNIKFSNDNFYDFPHSYQNNNKKKISLNLSLFYAFHITTSNNKTQNKPNGILTVWC